ncbi:MAG: gamma-glutamylcyclotransferase [Rhizobiaceae bacterium]|nr:gamma-glutamylcyclotransferase [Rhizobiaceae bacterium]
MDLTEALVTLVERTEPDPGPDPDTRELTEDDYEQAADEILRVHRPDALWVFAYGSLIWNPEFEFMEQRRAVAHGWHRSFCLKLTRWRGTRALPALMLALDRGGTCIGIAYKIAGDDIRKSLVDLARRELDAIPATNVPRWINISTAEGPLKALAFIALPNGRAYAGRLPLNEVAAVLARAAGHWGSSARYAFNTISSLEKSGIRDRNLWKLQKLVAAEIRQSVENSTRRLTE